MATRTEAAQLVSRMDTEDLRKLQNLFMVGLTSHCSELEDAQSHADLTHWLRKPRGQRRHHLEPPVPVLKVEDSTFGRVEAPRDLALY